MLDRAGVLDRVRRRAWGLSGRLTASYILVTLAVVVLVEALVLGFQVPLLLNSAHFQLPAQVGATAESYAQQLSQRYPGGVPPGTVLGDPGQPARPGQAPAVPDGSTLIIPAITGPVRGDQAVTAVVAIAADGTVLASSAPSRYPPGRAAARELPVEASSALAADPTHMAGKPPTASTPYALIAPRDGTSGWRQPLRRKLAELDEQIARAQAVREAIRHGLRCPHEDITQCPNFNAGITARLNGQPLSQSHQQLHGQRFHEVADSS